MFGISRRTPGVKYLDRLLGIWRTEGGIGGMAIDMAQTKSDLGLLKVLYFRRLAVTKHL